MSALVTPTHPMRPLAGAREQSTARRLAQGTSPGPLADLRAARAELLAAVQGCRPDDLLRPGADGERCGRDVLVHMAAWLRELTTLIPELTAGRGYDRLSHPPRDLLTWNNALMAGARTVRPEAALASLVTAHARLLDRLQGIDEAGLRRRGPTPWGFEASGWDLLVAEAAHERAHAARLAGRSRLPVHPFDGAHSGAAFLLPAC